MIRKFLFAAAMFSLTSQVALAQSPLDKFKQKVDELKPNGKLLRQLLGKDEEPEPPKTKTQSATTVRTPTPAQHPSPSPAYSGQPPLANYQPTLAGPHQQRARGSNGLGLITEESRQGLKVTLIQAGSPADRAGIRVNDRIIKFAGIGVETEEELNGIAGALRQGDQIEVSISRNGKPQDVVVTFGEAVNQDENSADLQTPAPPSDPAAAASANDFQSSAAEMQQELETLRRTVREQQQIILDLQQRLRAVQASQYRGR